MATQEQILAAVDKWKVALDKIAPLRTQKEVLQGKRDVLITQIQDLTDQIQSLRSDLAVAETELKALLNG